MANVSEQLKENNTSYKMNTEESIAKDNNTNRNDDSALATKKKSKVLIKSEHDLRPTTNQKNKTNCIQIIFNFL
jgi:hypothetical protein